jgi:hypothetical protein
MYDALTTSELTVWQDVLFSATEKAYRLAGLCSKSEDHLASYRSIHAEAARLFLEAGEELVNRLGNPEPARECLAAADLA